MGSIDRVDDRPFKADFDGEGAAKLRETVKNKLKECMGDYTDDTLVDYVIVLLRNGRRKEEARNELNVFLGDDSDSFVSWLWDHLSENIDLYAQTHDSHVIGGENDDSLQWDSDSERGQPNKLSKRRHTGTWRGLASDASQPPPLISSEIDSICFEQKTNHGVEHKRSSSGPLVRRKRSLHDDQQHEKREVAVNAPRRLLQIAVRDAVADSRPTNLREESLSKRLRSVVATPKEVPLLVGRPRRVESVRRVLNPMATVIKAVAEAAEDSKKSKSAGSVFDRLSRSTDAFAALKLRAESREPAGKDVGHGGFSEYKESSGQYGRSTTMMDIETGLAPDSVSDGDGGYVSISINGHEGRNARSTHNSGVNEDEDSTMMQYTVAADDSNRVDWSSKHGQPVAAAVTSHKMANVVGDVNTWNPLISQDSRRLADLGLKNSLKRNELSLCKVSSQSVEGNSSRLVKENSSPVAIGNGNGKLVTNTEEVKNTQFSTSGTYTASRPLEDADSRTIFVSNVHFAASKDSLSRHFNKFGEVLKVVIVTDAATGQPTGSAYVEFMRKEATDSALSLNGTSFMSRILKVVKRSAAPKESAPLLTWPRAVRGSPYSMGRFGTVPFPRGAGCGFRPHPMVKPGARSFQWKRDAQSEIGASAPGNSIPPQNAARGLTYVRPKLDTESSGVNPAV